MTQTTQDRISRIIFEGYESSLFEGYTVYNTEVPAGEIAAEIDALTERNAFLLTSAATAQAKLAEARAAVRDLTVSLENSERHVNDKDTIISELFVWENDPADSRTFAEFLDYLGALYPSAKMW